MNDAIARVEFLDDAHPTTAFRCGNSRLDDWLVRVAPAAAAAGTAATYVALADDERLVGYHALAMGGDAGRPPGNSEADTPNQPPRRHSHGFLVNPVSSDLVVVLRR